MAAYFHYNLGGSWPQAKSAGDALVYIYTQHVPLRMHQVF